MTTAAVLQLQEAMRNMPQIDPPVDNFFSEGIYARRMSLSTGDTVVGKTHKESHLAILLAGTVKVTSKYGTATYSAPYIVNVNAGDKRAFLAMSDCQWITIHATTETDLDKLEQALVEDK